MNDWELGWRPAGFIASAIPQAPKGHAVAYSDGLATFSVFVEPAGQLKMPQGASRIGATTVYTHDLTSGGKQFLVTVVGEIPRKRPAGLLNRFACRKARRRGRHDY
ncbi:MucB/RseB C-terminal domain-containing protein [Marinobacter koreensis]|uniref:MucB/RseB C-terminal domain-containing protein n=1 Tax=Marinobacter koreensis TaxID=335974 RepID=UPI00361BBA35